MKIQTAILLMVAVVLAGTWVVVHGIRSDQRYRKELERQTKSIAFEKGFWAGSRATVSALKLDTNTGKWTLELTNLFTALDKEPKN